MDVGEQRSWTNEELAALYDRFFAPLYDVSIRVLGSEDTAALAVGRAFSRAFAELRRRPVDELRPWLYGLLAPELPRRPTPASDPSFSEVDADRLANPQRLASDGRIAASIWAAAAVMLFFALL